MCPDAPPLTGALRRPLPREVLRVVCERTGFSEAEITGSRRLPALVRARRLAQYLIHVDCPRSVAEVGRMFGVGDASSARLAVMDVQKMLGAPEGRGLGEEVEAVRAQVRSAIARACAEPPEVKYGLSDEVARLALDLASLREEVAVLRRRQKRRST